MMRSGSKGFELKFELEPQPILTSGSGAIRRFGYRALVRLPLCQAVSWAGDHFMEAERSICLGAQNETVRSMGIVCEWKSLAISES